MVNTGGVKFIHIYRSAEDCTRRSTGNVVLSIGGVTELFLRVRTRLKLLVVYTSSKVKT